MAGGSENLPKRSYVKIAKVHKVLAQHVGPFDWKRPGAEFRLHEFSLLEVQQILKLEPPTTLSLQPPRTADVTKKQEECEQEGGNGGKLGSGPLGMIIAKDKGRSDDYDKECPKIDASVTAKPDINERVRVFSGSKDEASHDVGVKIPGAYPVDEGAKKRRGTRTSAARTLKRTKGKGSRRGRKVSHHIETSFIRTGLSRATAGALEKTLTRSSTDPFIPTSSLPNRSDLHPQPRKAIHRRLLAAKMQLPRLHRLPRITTWEDFGPGLSVRLLPSSRGARSNEDADTGSRRRCSGSLGFPAQARDYLGSKVSV